MDKRKEKRIKRRLLANISEHSAITLDISANGIQISMNTNPKTIIVDIKIKLENQDYNFKGKVKWIRRNPIKKTSNIGINVYDIPKDYKDKLKELFPLLATDDETQVEIDEINEMFGV